MVINRKRFRLSGKAHESAVVVRRLPFLRRLDSSGCSSSWSPQTSSMSAMWTTSPDSIPNLPSSIGDPARFQRR